MDDLISRQEVIDALRTMYDTHIIETEDGDEYINYNDTVYEVEQLPTVQPKTGHWIEHGVKEGHLIEKYTCSECDYYSGTKTTNYCPDCGAKMISEDCDIPIEYFENGGV